MAKPIFIMLAIVLLAPCAFAQPVVFPSNMADMEVPPEAESFGWADLKRLHRMEKKIRVVGNFESGEFKVTDFEIPEGHALADLQIRVDSTSVNEGWAFSGQSMSGWRLTRLDKFPKYTSRGQEKTRFTIEAWARKTGYWYSRKSSWLDLVVVYYYYEIEGLDENDFGKVIDLTLHNIHPIPVHSSAQTLYHMVEAGEENIEELILRRDAQCYWGSNPNCHDCIEIRQDEKRGKVYSFIYNAKHGDVVCQ